MRLKKWFAIVLAAAVLLSTLAGCGAALNGDTVVMTAGDKEITYNEYQNWLLYAKNAFVSSYGEVSDWTKPLTTEATYETFLLDYTEGLIRYAAAIDENAAALGIQLTDEDYAQIKKAYETAALQYPSEDEFKAALVQNYGSMEFYNYMQENNALYNRCFIEQYGENGEKLSDEEVLAFAESQNYIWAKHIIIMKIDDDGNLLSDEEAAAAKAEAESILARLDAYTGDDIEGYFDELMNAYSQDDGLEAFPDGYVFTEGDMVDEFYDGAIALADYEYSGIVESGFGYHIILRLPLEPTCVPISYFAYGYDLRYLAAESMFESVVSGWWENLELVKTDSYAKIDTIALLSEKDK